MNINDWALIMAGAIGTISGIQHGLETQKFIVSPIYGQAKYPLRMRRIAAALLHFSTYCWVLGGLGLIAAPLLLHPSSTLTLAIVVAGFYVFGAIGNFWGTQGKHRGWAQLSIAVGFILVAIWA